MSALQRDQLLGSWLLTEWRIDYPGGAAANWPFGKDAVGLLIYGADGWMSATMSCRARAPLSAASAVQADDASTARAFREYLAYSGRWRLEGSAIAHEVEMSMNPVLIGSCQWRDAHIEGPSLLLGASESLGRGRMRQHQIRWRRAPAG